MNRAEQDVAEAKAKRERLERASPSGARVNVVGVLNELAKGHAAQEAPGFAALEAIRKGQRHGYKTEADHNRAHAKFERTAEGLGFLKGLRD